MRKKILILTGPTGVGKSDLSIQAAKALNGEIISADSMQIYKDLDIGTGKITEKEMQGIPHYGLSHIHPFDEYSVAEFSKDVKDYVHLISNKNKLPILVGGTGLYLHSIIYQLDFFQTEKNSDLRKDLELEWKEKGLEALAYKLTRLNPKRAEKVDLQNPQRLIRALEIELENPKQESQGLNKKNSLYDPCLIILNRNREELYHRINCRVDKMVEAGLFQEVKNLIDRGLTLKNQSMRAIGYKEIFDYYKEKRDYSETIELIKRNSRRYAKRQLTWYRRYDQGIWINLSDLNEEEALEEIIINWRQ